MPIDIHRGYFTVIIPYVPRPHQTEWHPDSPDGPFRELSRGAFETQGEAIEWARAHLGGAPYSIKPIPPLATPVTINLLAMRVPGNPHNPLAQIDRDAAVRRVATEVADSTNYGAQYEYSSCGDHLALAVRGKDNWTNVYDCKVMRCATFNPDGKQIE